MKVTEYKGFYITHCLVICHVADVIRRRKVENLLKQYLYQQEKNCFEGELSLTQMAMLRQRISLLIDHKKDVAIIYPLAKQNIFAKQVLGKLRYKITRIY